MLVTKQGKGYVARYTEVDASTMTTEIYPGKPRLRICGPHRVS